MKDWWKIVVVGSSGKFKEIDMKTKKKNNKIDDKIATSISSKKHNVCFLKKKRKKRDWVPFARHWKRDFANKRFFLNKVINTFH